MAVRTVRERIDPRLTDRLRRRSRGKHAQPDTRRVGAYCLTCASSSAYFLP